MKTTVELDDALLTEARKVATRRKTTLKALLEHALRREIQPEAGGLNPDPTKFEVGPLGLLVLKRGRRHPAKKSTTLQDIQRIQRQIDEEEIQQSIKSGRPK